MKLFDEKARRNIRPYFIQCGLASLTIVLILVFLDVIKHTAIIATLGSSVFLIFALPSAYSSRARPLLGGYLIAIIIGSLFYFFTTLSVLEHLHVSIKTIYIVLSAMAVGFTIFYHGGDRHRASTGSRDVTRSGIEYLGLQNPVICCHDGVYAGVNTAPVPFCAG